jgi:heavy metal sensor kinase
VTHWSLRRRLIIWISVLVAVTLCIFGVLSAWTLYHEQMEAAEASLQKPTLTAQDLQAEAEDLLEDLLFAYAISLPVAVIVAAWGVWFLTRKALQPVREMAQTAEQIHARALHQRLPVPWAKDDVGKLAVILNSLFERLEKSFIQTSRFSADASHELKTPLTIMRAEIEAALKREPEDPSVLENLLEQTQRISAITTKLLLLAKADAGQLQPERLPVDLSGLCSELVEDAEILATPRHIHVQSEITPGLKLAGDELLLRQAVLNLLDNAIKYNDEGGLVKLILRADPERLSITVSNTGPGIPAEHMHRIFERFYRVDPSRSSETGGSGLGLSICREIVLAHGGHLHLESVPHALTSFLMEFPESKEFQK